MPIVSCIEFSIDQKWRKLIWLKLCKLPDSRLTTGKTSTLRSTERIAARVGEEIEVASVCCLTQATQLASNVGPPRARRDAADFAKDSGLPAIRPNRRSKLRTNSHHTSRLKPTCSRIGLQLLGIRPLLPRTNSRPVQSHWGQRSHCDFA